MAKKIVLVPIFISLFASNLVVLGSFMMAYLSTKENYQGKLMSLLAIRSPIMPLNAMRVLVQTKTLWCLSIILGILVVYCFSGSKKEGIK
jgi:hypothetical protein